MTKEEIKKFLDNTKVYVNGKSEEIQKKLFSFGYKWRGEKVEVLNEDKPFLFISNKGWIKHSDDMFFFKNHKFTEITDEQILSLELTECYRPFKDREECWNEMLKHQPFGWMCGKSNYKQIQAVVNGGVKIVEVFFTFDEAVDYTFADGTPFGIKQ